MALSLATVAVKEVPSDTRLSIVCSRCRLHQFLGREERCRRCGEGFFTSAKLPFSAPLPPPPSASTFDLSRIGRNVTAWRNRIGMTQTKLAEHTGMTRSGLSRIENGNYYPSLAVLEKVSEAVGVSLRRMLESPPSEIEQEFVRGLLTKAGDERRRFLLEVKTLMDEVLKVLTTFSGKAGDVIWSLPTVRLLAEKYGRPVDFACMPAYRSLLPLLNSQSYINKAFVIENWVCTGSPHGDQPWEAPVAGLSYAQIHHLTYRHHPQGECLAQAIARTQGLSLGKFVPFLDVPSAEGISFPKPCVAYAFNESYANVKSTFLGRMKEAFSNVSFVDTSKLPWLTAAVVIKNASLFLGCRSSNAVLAHGVGQKVLCFEPDPGRRSSIFGCPEGVEVMPDPMDVASFVSTLKGWLC